MPSILIIEDEENLRLTIAKRMRKVACNVEEAASIAEARSHLAAGVFDIVITDVNLPDGDGVELVSEIASSESGADTVVITAYGTVEHAVDAMRRGAADYLQKPVRLDELAMIITRIFERRTERTRLELYERAEHEASANAAVVGQDPVWLEQVKTARRFAEAHANPESEGPLPSILITGETGSGKGVIARMLHDHAVAQPEASDGAFVHVNCAALPANLVESELFGHEKGAFTDAKSARVGYFELADGGTLFLDEIAEMSPELQAKLLLVMENGTYRRVGGEIERRVSARVIAATNQDLAQRVADKSFREDLYYRLGAFVIALPPLRDRAGDAQLLAEQTLERLSRRRGKPGVRFSDAAIARIAEHHWPGNARELVNAVQRALILCKGNNIEPADLAIISSAIPPSDTPGTRHSGPVAFDFEHGPHTIEAVERALIEQALTRCDGNITQAARLVGMPRGSFRYRMEKAGLTSYGA